MIIVVAIAFVVAWSPFYLTTFISQVQTNSFLRRSNYVFVMLAVHLVGFINSCINPVIYNFMSDKFRKSFTQIVLSLCCLCTRVPRVRKCISLRSRDIITNTTDYNVEDSGTEFPKEEVYRSPGESRRGRASRRCEDDRVTTPNTTAIPLSTLSDQDAASGQLLCYRVPNRGLSNDQNKRLTNGSTCSYLSPSAPSERAERRLKGTRCPGDNAVLSVRRNPVTIETSLTRDQSSHQDVSDLDFDTDLFELATSKLLHHASSHAD